MTWKIVAALLVAGAVWIVQHGRRQRHTPLTVSEQTAEAAARQRPCRIEDMPGHPERPGVFDDYTEQRYRQITAPLTAEHSQPRTFVVDEGAVT